MDIFDRMPEGKADSKLVNKIIEDLLQLRQILSKVMREDIYISTKIIDAFLDVAKGIYNRYEYGISLILTHLKSPVNMALKLRIQLYHHFVIFYANLKVNFSHLLSNK